MEGPSYLTNGDADDLLCTVQSEWDMGTGIACEQLERILAVTDLDCMNRKRLFQEED